MLVLLPLLLAVARPALEPVAQEVGRTFESAEQGFAIERPAGWAFHETARNERGRYMLRVYRPEDEGLVAATVEVERSGAYATAEAAVEAALDRVRGAAGYSELEQLRGNVGGRELPGLSALLDAPELGRYRIRQHYLLADGRLYVLQVHAPVEAFERHLPRMEAALSSFRLIAVERDAAEALRARCGSEVEWAASWEEAAARARTEGKPVLVAVRFQPGFEISDVIRQITFMDPDLVELTGERFVPLRLEKGMDAPFVAQSSYGVGPMAFGTALLYCSAAGEVLHDTPVLDPRLAYPLLVEWLARHPEHAGAAAPGEASALERAERHLRRGELRAALAACEGEEGASALLVRARAHRLLRDGAAAQDALAAAREARGAGEIADELAREALVLAMRREADGEAQALAERLIEVGGPAADAARYWLGVIAARSERLEEARARWEALVRDAPESRWAWRAAAALADPRVQLGLELPTRFARDEELRELRARPAQRLGLRQLQEVERTALAWLLAEQRPDGSWPHARGRGGSAREVSSPFTDAVTAIGGLACLGRGEADAAARALQYVLDLRARRAADERPTVFMDYTDYADAWAIRFLGACLEAGLGSAPRLRAEIEALVDSLAAKQRANGGWSYYLSGAASEDAPRVEQSISFVTALVALALLDAEAAGVEVPRQVLDGVLGCLEAMRSEAGTFAYMLAVGGTAPPASAPDSAGRAPACELALLRGGRSDRARLTAALEMFDAHVDGLAKEVGKALMHCGPAGQGCHYVFFDYQTAAEACAELAPGAVARARALLAERILDARAEGGAFRDSPLNGWAYGTAMALLALDALGGRGL